MNSDMPYCRLVGRELDVKVVGRIGSAITYKNSMQACMALGTQSIRLNKYCHESNCKSQWRVCPACIIQGDVKKVSDPREIFSVGMIGNQDCCLCEFHFTFGPDKRRSDGDLTAATLKVFSLPPEFEVVRDGNVQYKKIPLPQLSDFFHQKEREVVDLYSKAINNEMSPEEARRLRGEIMSYFEKRYAKCLREQAAKTDNFEIVSVYDDEQPQVEKVVEAESLLAEAPIDAKKPKRKYRKRAAKIKADELMSSVEARVGDQKSETEKLLCDIAQSIQEDTHNYGHLEDPSHGISVERIVLPSWHPQLYFNEETLPDYIRLIEEGYAINVNVSAGVVELVDDVGFLMAAKEMRLMFPPLEISNFNFPDVCMLICLNRVNLSEWEKYRLFNSMLAYTKQKTLAKWAGLKEVELQKFMQQGNALEEKGDELFFMQLVIENIPLSYA